MLPLIKKTVSSVCPKTDKLSTRKQKGRWLIWLFPFTGLVALLWFLVRVLPKPSRATYPCQRVAFPLASGFVIWLLGLPVRWALFVKLNAIVRKHVMCCVQYSLPGVLGVSDWL